MYAPNTYEEEFYSQLLAKVATVSLPFTILSKYFNCTMDPEVDQSSKSRAASPKMRKVSREVCTDLQLFDAWRVCNPREKDYTFFSHPHQCSSQIDYFFISRMVMMDRVEDCKIGTQLLSDYSDLLYIFLCPHHPHNCTLGSGA